MKYRVISRDGKFIPQSKDGWFSGWRNFVDTTDVSKATSDGEQIFYPPYQFDTGNEAIEFIDKIKNPKKPETFVVWQD
jgi:hypothetical protein